MASKSGKTNTKSTQSTAKSWSSKQRSMASQSGNKHQEHAEHRKKFELKPAQHGKPVRRDTHQGHAEHHTKHVKRPPKRSKILWKEPVPANVIADPSRGDFQGVPEEISRVSTGLRAYSRQAMPKGTRLPPRHRKVTPTQAGTRVLTRLLRLVRSDQTMAKDKQSSNQRSMVSQSGKTTASVQHKQQHRR
jgi:hypothetical protein